MVPDHLGRVLEKNNCHSTHGNRVVLPLLDVRRELTHEAVEDITQQHQLIDSVPADHGEPSCGDGWRATVGFYLPTTWEAQLFSDPGKKKGTLFGEDHFSGAATETRPRLARKHNIASEVGPTLQDAFFFPPRSICEASARQRQARCSAQTGRCKLVCASCSTQVALRKLLCASCSAQVAPASWSLQVAPCKLLCANCAPCKLLCASCSVQVALCKLLCVSCSAQVALGKALCANWSVQVGLRKLLCATCSAQVALHKLL